MFLRHLLPALSQLIDLLLHFYWASNKRRRTSQVSQYFYLENIFLFSFYGLWGVSFFLFFCFMIQVCLSPRHLEQRERSYLFQFLLQCKVWREYNINNLWKEENFLHLICPCPGIENIPTRTICEDIYLNTINLPQSNVKFHTLNPIFRRLCEYFMFFNNVRSRHCYSCISIQKEYKNRMSWYSAANLDSVREAIFCYVAGRTW